MSFLKKKICSALLISVLLISMCSTTAFAAFEELNVPQYKQEKGQWCWAAAAHMAGKYKYSASDVTQTDIVVNEKGSAVNKPGSILETARSIEYVTNNTENASASTSWGKFTWSKIKTSIDNGYPIVPLVNDGSSGHYYVIRGYEESTSKIALNDPWDGNRYTCTWKDFNEGTWEGDSRPHAYTVYFNDYNK